MQISNQIITAMRKVATTNLTASIFSKNLKEAMFIPSDKAFSFINSTKGTPAYWKKFLHKVFAMIKQAVSANILFDCIRWRFQME